MSLAKGINTRLIMALETTFGTVPTLGTNNKGLLVPYVSENVRKTQNMIESKAISNSRNARRPGRGNFAVEGDIKTELNPWMYWLFAYTFGNFATKDSLNATINVNSADTGTPPYTHTFKIDFLPVGFTLEKKFYGLGTPSTGGYHQYSGCRINKFEFSFGSDGFVDATFSLLGKDLTIANASISPSDTNDLVYEHKPWDVFELASADVKVGGSSVGYISKMQCTIENVLEGTLYAVGGAGLRKAIPEGIVKVTGKMTVLFGDTTGADAKALLTTIFNGTESSIDLTFKRGTGDGSAGNETMRIYLPDVIFTADAPVCSGAGGVLAEIPFTAFYYSDASGTTAEVVLMNANLPRM